MLCELLRDYLGMWHALDTIDLIEESPGHDQHYEALLVMRSLKRIKRETCTLKLVATNGGIIAIEDPLNCFNAFFCSSILYWRIPINEVYLSDINARGLYKLYLYYCRDPSAMEFSNPRPYISVGHISAYSYSREISHDCMLRC